MQKVAVFVLTGLGALGVAAIGTLVPETVRAEQFSREVGVPLQEAKKAMDRKQFDAALVQLKKAQGVPGKKPHEDYVINEMLTYVYTQQKNYPEAIRAIEANLAAGRASPADVAAKQKTLTQMYVATRNWPKVIQYGNNWVKANPGDAEGYYQLAQAYSQAGQHKNAVRTIQQALDLNSKAGKKPEQNWLVLKLDSQHKVSPPDEEGIIETREMLVRHYPSKDNWKAVLAKIYNQPSNDDLATLNLLRLMLDLDLLEKPADYKDMAEMAIAGGMPAEAVVVLEKGFANKTLEVKDKERYVRLLNNAKIQVQASTAETAKLEAEAKGAATGEADVKLGSRYLASGEYQKAVAALNRGLQKGGFKGQDEAHMMLGRAHLKLKEKDKARKAFGAVPDDSKLAQVAQLWGVYAAQS